MFKDSGWLSEDPDPFYLQSPLSFGKERWASIRSLPGIPSSRLAPRGPPKLVLP